MYESSLKSAEDYPNCRNTKESVVEVRYVIDKSVVYKIFMVRMYYLVIGNTGEFLNVRV